MEYLTSIILDTRRKKSNGLYPVKLRVYSAELQIKKFYATKYDLTEKDFTSIWKTTKTRNEHKEVRLELQAIEARANDICKKLKPFSFVQFERKFLRNKGDGSNIIYQYGQIIAKLKSENRFSTASNYELSLKSLIEFVKYTKGKEPTKIPFADITAEWLQKYENYMISHLNRSRTTVSMYLRALRTVFNSAIRDKEIDMEIYPFGKNKYQPPTVRNVKKAFNNVQLKQLFKSKPQTPEQEKAKDYWFFSYACNGMNIKDIAQLKNEDLQDDKIIFYRAKTLNTSKTNLKPITVYLNEFSKSVIKKYQNKKNGKGEYIFTIISQEDDEFKKYIKIQNFTKFINQNIKKLAMTVGITEEISTYWARHSFATTAIRNGATMEFMMEALGHGSTKTTAGYFAGFEDKDKKEFMQGLMDF